MNAAIAWFDIICTHQTKNKPLNASLILTSTILWLSLRYDSRMQISYIVIMMVIYILRHCRIYSGNPGDFYAKN